MNRFVLPLFFTATLARVGSPEPIPTRYQQGSLHGFLLVKSPQGKVIGAGEVMQVAQGSEIHSRLVFRFKDGSLDEESVVFSERDVLHLVSDHHVQKGPSFPAPLNITINVPRQAVKWQQTKNGRVESHTEHLDLPNDLANGMIPLVLDNLAADGGEKTVSFLVSTPKPRIVKLSFKPGGQDRFTVGGLAYSATRYDIHVDLGGFAAILAPLIGKQPPDLHGWVVSGQVPCFAKIEGPFYEGGPIWTVEIASPVWPSPTR